MASVSTMDTSPPRVTRSILSGSTDKNLNKWSKNEMKQLKEMISWGEKLSAFYKEQLEIGPGSKKEPPKMPKNNLQSKIMGSQKKSPAKQPTAAKQKQLSGSELNEYLQQFYLPDINVETVYFTNETLGQNLNEIASNLKRAYQYAEYIPVN